LEFVKNHLTANFEIYVGEAGASLGLSKVAPGRIGAREGKLVR